MKNFFSLAIVMVIAYVANAQAFEGTLTWSVQTEITDPRAKAQMEEAQKKMKDPANQAKMKEAMERMNDPQVKAMMEANPQMKAQMESMVKMLSGGDMNSMMPSAIAVKVKSGNSLTRITGGMMDKMEMLYLKDKNMTYRMDRENKTYSPMPSSSNDNDRNLETKVTKTSETTKILNYTCTKYIIESKAPDGNSMTTNYWTTTEIKDFDFKALARQQVDKKAPSFFYENVEGVPMRIEMNIPQGKMTMEMTEFKKAAQPASDFSIPAGYKQI